MKKFMLALIIVPFFAAAQEETNYPRMEGDSLVLECGFKVGENQELKIGTGSTPDGSFKFIRISATSMFNNFATKPGYEGAADRANALPRNNSGMEFKVVRIDKRGSKKHGYVYYPIINVGATRYEIDIWNAISAGELVVPDDCKPKKEGATVVVKQEVSVADELAKLKKLMDDGVITKDEFEAQKKKLLEKQ